MSGGRFDETLRERFARLAAEESERIPDFVQMYARAQEAAEDEVGEHRSGQAEVLRLAKVEGERSSSRGRMRAFRHGPWPWMAGTLAAAALATIVILSPDQDDAEFEALVTAFAESSGGWNAPTGRSVGSAGHGSTPHHADD